MKKTEKQLGKQLGRALFDVTTINEANRTIDVVAATETPILKRTCDGIINEILVCQPGNVRMDRINSGAPVLDTHNNYSLDTQVGVVERAWVEAGQLKATLRFAKDDVSEIVWQKVVDKIVRNVSIGYRVYEYDITEKLDKAIPDYRATDWEPMEISMVPVPADPNSGVRSQNEETNTVKITQKNNNMKIAAQIIAAVRAAGLPMEFAETLLQDDAVTIESARALIDAEKTRVAAIPAPAPAPAAKKDKTASEILHAVRSAGLELEFAEGLINTEGITIDAARAAVIAELAKNQQPAQRTANPAAVVPGKDATDKRRKAMSTALLLRTSPALVKAEDAPMAADFRGMDLMDMARTCVEEAGIPIKGLLKREIAQIALNIGERQLSTSDFPLILGNTINRSLRAAYEIAPRTFPAWTYKKNAKDFREMASVTLGDLSSLLKVVEGAEYKNSTIGEGAEKYRVAKYGTIINITWETLINDDLGAFDRIPQKLATAAANTQSDIMYGILSVNAALSDTVALFHATHANLAGTGTAISVASLGVARQALRNQKAPGGSYLNLTPKYLIVGPASEMTALQFTSSMYTSTKGADINPWVGMLTVIVEPRITGNEWYLAADPSAVDTIEYAFLDGEELFTEQKLGFEVDGMQTKVRMVFGAKAIDFRGLYKNAGA